MSDGVQRISMWSGPRNVSTALMYSFAQRSDTRVIDEPLYAHFLKVTGARHPLRERCLAAQDQDGERVVRETILGRHDSRVVFFKQMAHHLVDLDLSFMRHSLNVFLTRSPWRVLPSLRLRIGMPTLRDTGFKRQLELIEMLEAWGQRPAVLDSRELLLSPEGSLRALCEHLGISFQRRMLGWPPGPKPYDGVWASEWYRSAHRTTGFEPLRPRATSFPDDLKPLLDECAPHYEQLLARAIRPSARDDRP